MDVITVFTRDSADCMIEAGYSGYWTINAARANRSAGYLVAYANRPGHPQHKMPIMVAEIRSVEASMRERGRKVVTFRRAAPLVPADIADASPWPGFRNPVGYFRLESRPEIMDLIASPRLRWQECGRDAPVMLSDAPPADPAVLVVARARREIAAALGLPERLIGITISGDAT